MKPDITEVKPFGEHAWEIVLSLPNGHRNYRIKAKRDYPDELSVYVATQKELKDEYGY